MTDEIDDRTYDALLTQPHRQHFTDWLAYHVKRSRTIIFVVFVGLTAWSWYASMYVAPILFVMVLVAVVKIMKSFSKRGYTYVVEFRMAGEIITHCDYYQKPIQVPDGGLRIHLVPNARLRTAFMYGDTTPMLNARDIFVVDYFEQTDDGHLILVFPKDNNFGNAAMVGRANSELAAAVHQIGRMREANHDLRAAVVQMFHEGRLGDDPEQASRRLQDILADVDMAEQKLGATAASRRDVWKFYKNAIPDLRKSLVHMEQMLPALVMAEASKLFHDALDVPMTREVSLKVEETLERANAGASMGLMGVNRDSSDPESEQVATSPVRRR